MYTVSVPLVISLDRVSPAYRMLADDLKLSSDDEDAQRVGEQSHHYKVLYR